MRLRGVAVLAGTVAALWIAAVAVWAAVWPVRADAQPTYIPPTVVVASGAHANQSQVAEQVARIVNDPRGWRTDLGQYTIRIVRPGSMGTNPMPGVAARAYPELHTAVISDQAWNLLGPRFAALGGTLDDQRTWAVLHEIGHLLGHAHTDCTGSGPAPVMRPASYGIGACDFNVWVHG